MRQLLLLLLFPLAAASTSAQGIAFFNGTFEQAAQKAAAEGKLLFVDMHTEWCGPCKKMAAEVFTRPEVGEYFNRTFVCLKLDAEKEGEPQRTRYKVGVFPTLLFLDGEGNLVHEAAGSLDACGLLNAAKKAGGAKDDPDSPFNLEKNYPAHKHDEQFLARYLHYMPMTGKRCYEAVDDYLRVQRSMREEQSEMMEFLMEHCGELLLGGKAEEILNRNMDTYLDIAAPSEAGRLRQIGQRMFISSRDMALERRDAGLFRLAMEYWANASKKPVFGDYGSLKLELLLLEGDTAGYRRQATIYLDSIANPASIAHIHDMDKEYYEKMSGSLNASGNFGLYADMAKEVYRNRNARWQTDAIVKESRLLLEGAKRKDFRNMLRWSDYAMQLMPENYLPVSLHAEILYRRGKRAGAIASMERALGLIPEGDRAEGTEKARLEAMKSGKF